MQVQLIKEDMEGDFYDNQDCPLARALKRLGYKDVYVGGLSVDFDGHEVVAIRNFIELAIATEYSVKEPIIVELDIEL